MTATFIASETAERMPTDPATRHGTHTSHRVSTRRGLRFVTPSRLITIAGLALWLISLPSLKSAHVTTYGLLFAGSPLFTAAAAATVIAFLVAVRRGSFGDAVLALAAFMAVARVTVSVITPLPIYTWTYKHLGVISYIQQTGHVARNVDIYMNWPGAFTALAWFSSLTGVSTLALAQWFAVGVHVLIAAGVYALCRAYGQAPMVAITGAFIAEAVNWVGQDYLSPQAIAFVLSLAVLTLMVRSQSSPRAAYLSIPIFAAITVTHQLTPFWLAGLALALALFKAISPRWLGLAYVGIALGYLALNIKIAMQYGLLSGFDPLANAQGNVTTAGSAGHDFTSDMVKIPSILLWGLTAVTVVVLWRRRRAVHKGRRTGTVVSPLGPALMAFSSFGLLAGQSYGGEAIFRVFLYSIPGCVLVTAPVIVGALTYQTNSPRRSRQLAVRLAPITSALVVLLMAVTSLQGYYGGWFTNLIRRDSYNESVHLLSTLPTNALILSLNTGMPERPIGRYVDFVKHEKFYDAEIELVPGVTGSLIANAKVLQRLEQIIGPVSGPVYLVITQEMINYSDYYGVYPKAALATFREKLGSDGNWQTIVATPTLHVYRFIGKRT